MGRDDVEVGLLGNGLGFMKLGSGPPVVLAPGLSPDHTSPRGFDLWFQLWRLRPLSGSRTVWWVNRRVGLGLHSNMADIADDYAHALRTTFDAPVDLIGISTGGAIALQLTVDHPDVVRRVVVAASGPRLGIAGKREAARLAHHVRARRPRSAAAEYIGGTGATPVTRALLGALGWLLGSALFSIDDPDDALATIEAEDGYDVSDRLGEINKPVLFISGTRDQAYDNGERFTDTADRVAGARLILYRGKGHLGVLSSRQVARDAAAFLGASSPSDREAPPSKSG